MLVSSTSRIAADRSPLASLDPRTKILGAIALMAMSFFVGNLAQGALALAMVFSLLGLGDLSVGRFFRSVVPIVLPLIVVAALNLVVTRSGPVIWSWGFLSVTLDGAATALAYGFRVTLIVCFGATLLATTPAGELADAFARLLSPLRRLGAPVEEWALVFSLALRFVPTLAGEFHAVREAQASRGGTIARGRATQRLRALVALVVPVFAAALRHADNLSLALDSRAWESGGVRTRWHPLRFTGRDAAASAVLVFYAVILTALS